MPACRPLPLRLIVRSLALACRCAAVRRAQDCMTHRVAPPVRIATWMLLALVGPALVSADETFRLRLRDQVEAAPGSAQFRPRERAAQWNPAETAIIVCDVWDYHHSLNAVRRLEQFAPRLNDLLTAARERGATIIHSPSDCMAAYADHPARARAVAAPPAKSPPPDVDLWCSRVPAEERADYPLDQSDGGDDDDPAEHAVWAAKLKAMGRNPALPWQKQSPLITIDAERDFISDRGDEVWNVLEARGIRRVVLTGVHLNMCVLGRPFGLRQMVRGGREVVLVRDLTDVMYAPARWPYVHHYTALERMVDHVERFVCPTITSDQLLGGRPFRFADDKRPHLAIVVAEEGYGTAETLPRFAARHLGRDFRVSFVFGDAKAPHDLPGLNVLDEADAALVSVRRRTLRPETMAIVRRFVAAGKPVLGLRTASHAFALRDAAQPPAGTVAWPEFDAEVFGGNYHGHPQTQDEAEIRTAAGAADHPILAGVPREAQRRTGGLYQVSPFASGAVVLWEGANVGKPTEPVVWTFRRADGGRSFYTSLGERADFEDPAFVRLLVNAVYWATDTSPSPPPREDHWPTAAVPGPIASAGLSDADAPLWLRCVVRVPKSWRGTSAALELPAGRASDKVWLNGTPAAASGDGRFAVAADSLIAGDANLVVVRRAPDGERGFASAPALSSSDRTISLAGRWQVRTGDDPSWSNMPLPAKFGTATDIIKQQPADHGTSGGR